MRDAVTSAMEVVGMMTFVVAVAVAAGQLWIGVAVAGLVLLAAGVVEGRR